MNKYPVGVFLLENRGSFWVGGDDVAGLKRNFVGAVESYLPTV